MNENKHKVLGDPNFKINFSTDDMIQLNYNTKENIKGKAKNKNRRKKKKSAKRKSKDPVDHSVPLFSSSTGARIFVSKSSPLLNAENQNRITKALPSTTKNLEPVDKSKKLISAEYKPPKTDSKFERDLVSAVNYSRPVKKLSHLRKLKSSFDSVQTGSLPTRPLPATTPVSSPNVAKMEVGGDEIMMDSPKPAVVGFDLDLLRAIIDMKKMCLVHETNQNQFKTLNDRFTMLSGNFQF